VAGFTADLVNKSTKTRSATQIAETIDQVGGSLEASANMESTSISARGLTDSVNVLFELMNDVVMNATFSAEELGRAQQQSESNLVANMQDPDFLADAVFERAIYGAHPYGHLQGGTLASIPRIRRDDLVTFRDTYYAPNISALAIVGDLPTAESFRLAEQWFGAWPKKDIPQRTETDIEPVGRAFDRRQTGFGQTKIRVGPPRSKKDPDYFNVLVASYVLGDRIGPAVSGAARRTRFDIGAMRQSSRIEDRVSFIGPRILARRKPRRPSTLCWSKSINSAPAKCPPMNFRMRSRTSSEAFP
jgi:zinc protease